MKKKIFTAVLSLALLSGYCFAADNNRQLFTVEADAIVRVKPDKAVFNVAVITKGKNLAETKKKNSDIIKKAVEYCKKAGIQEKNIQTDYVSIRPEYRNYYDLTESIFTVDQSLVITLEDISKYDNVLTELLNIGINQVYSVNFQLNDLKKYRNESRKLAIAAAKERAAFLAQEAGIKLGDIVNLSDYSRNWFPFGGHNMTSNVSQNMMQSNAGSGGDSSDNSDTLVPGMVSVKSNITLTYEIKNK